MLSYEEKLSIRPELNAERLEKAINNTSWPVNLYGKRQLQKALDYYNADYEVIKKAVNGKSRKKFLALYKDDEDIISFYFNKYNSIKPAIGALCFYLLYYTKDNVQQTNRILHRTPLFKHWNNASSNEDQSIVDWDEAYLEAAKSGKSLELVRTKGEIEIETFKYKRS